MKGLMINVASNYTDNFSLLQGVTEVQVSPNSWEIILISLWDLWEM
jgi:hypothetical protein